MRVWHSLRSGRSVSRRRWPSVGRWVSFFSFSLRLACFIYFLSCCWCGRVEAAVNWLGHAHSSNTKNKKIPRKQKVFFFFENKTRDKRMSIPRTCQTRSYSNFFQLKTKVIFIGFSCFTFHGFHLKNSFKFKSIRIGSCKGFYHNLAVLFKRIDICRLCALGPCWAAAWWNIGQDFPLFFQSTLTLIHSARLAVLVNFHQLESNNAKWI